MRDKINKIETAANSHKIKIETVKFNNTKTQNLKLRNQIDVMRKELLAKKSESERLIKLTEKAKKLATEQNQQAISNQKMADEHI